MKTDVKKKWLKALRSGDYQQGEGFLKSADNKYCCLGVLAEVMGIKNNIINTKYDNCYFFYFKDNFCTGGLSGDFRREVGLKRKTVDNLVGMNDVDKKNFREIASYISRNL